MNTKDLRNQIGTITAQDFANFMLGNLSDNYLYNITATLTGNANRYWRARNPGSISRTTSMALELGNHCGIAFRLERRLD